MTPMVASNFDVESELFMVLDAYHDAMVAGSIDALDELVHENFSLVHITGYVQPKQEWFEEIETYQFHYHRIRVDEESLSVIATGDHAVVRGRGIFDATINGIRSPWRLQFTVRFSRSGRWRIDQAQYGTF